ncbi:hypothetical protein MKK64_19005 [Methylobacterium sp. E-025]|uniref:hypothetical protein n=1 Tax=Methylobacterium sp. E-025 TaxID=2836561 RepID=UPI001FB8E289|nr:hypothetical protein [Methylobacterium sp. E-025]MCJ2113271.1 hypothetical protein [Methylobacterium sp. E-025]
MTMLTFRRCSGALMFEISCTGLRLGDFFDSFVGIDGTRGRQFFDGMWHADGFSVWAGRRRLVLECPPLARFFESLFTPPTAAA